MSWCFIWYL